MFLLWYRFHTLKIAEEILDMKALKIALHLFSGSSVKVFQLYPDFSISPSAFTQLHFLIRIFLPAVSHPHFSIRVLSFAFYHIPATQHCWALHVARVWPRCCDMLSQQHPACRNTPQQGGQTHSICVRADCRNPKLPRNS